EGLADRALRSLAATVPGDGPVLVNPTARTRGGVVELRLRGTDAVPPGCQLVSERPAERLLMEAPVEVATVTVAELEHIRGIRSFSLEATDGTELLHAERDAAGALVTP